jgi:hypothetical protein
MASMRAAIVFPGEPANFVDNPMRAMRMQMHDGRDAEFSMAIRQHRVFRSNDLTERSCRHGSPMRVLSRQQSAGHGPVCYMTSSHSVAVHTPQIPCNSESNNLSQRLVQPWKQALNQF